MKADGAADFRLEIRIVDVVDQGPPARSVVGSEWKLVDLRTAAVVANEFIASSPMRAGPGPTASRRVRAS